MDDTLADREEDREEPLAAGVIAETPSAVPPAVPPAVQPAAAAAVPILADIIGVGIVTDDDDEGEEDADDEEGSGDDNDAMRVARAAVDAAFFGEDSAAGDDDGAPAAGTSTAHAESPATRAAALRKAGNEAFSRSQFEEAISAYTACLKIVTESEEEATLLSNRSAAFASLCQQYRSRPAERSERHALFGLDPTHVAQLALKDAKRAVQLKPDWPKALSRQGLALFLLERYGEAEEAYLLGLGLEPTNQGLQDGLKEVARVQAAQELENPVKRQRMLGKAAADDLECTLCFKILYEPVTTPCGHSFCRGCFCRALEHSNKCPLCRTILHIGRELPITVTLATVLEKSFPEEYAERRAEEAGAASGGAVGSADQPGVALPLFVMSAVLPGEKMALNVFEPRYRLMARRCMEGNRRFGMAEAKRDREGGVEEVACEVEILECYPLPDGRYYIEIIGRRRVRLGATWELDGYRMARALPFTDDAPAEASPQLAALPALAAEVDTLSSALVERLRGMASRGVSPERLREFLDRTGQKPPAGQHEALSFWGASLMINYLPNLNGRDRMRLMTMTSTFDRLTWLRDHLLAVSGGGSGSCAVM